MGILQELEQKGLCYPIKRGGFISPSGNECIGGPYGSVSKVKNVPLVSSKVFRLEPTALKELSSTSSLPRKHKKLGLT
jgi:hypothetical protein